MPAEAFSTSFPSSPETIEPPFATQVGLFVTYRCTARCTHCMVSAGPERTEEMDVAEARGWIHQMSSCGVEAIGFTGGEPFCCFEKMAVLAETCLELGLKHAVITNAYWATSSKKTMRLLSRLRPSDVSVSTDSYHSEHVPLDNVRRVHDSCAELGIRFDLTVAWEPEAMGETQRILDRVMEFSAESSVRLTRVFPFGRGQNVCQNEGRIVRREATATPCLFASTPYILPDGEVRPCVGPLVTLSSEANPMLLGSLTHAPFAAIIEQAAQNVVLQGVRLWGPRFLELLVERYGPAERLPAGYTTDAPCEACFKLLSDSQIRGFLLQILQSSALRSSVMEARRRVFGESETGLRELEPDVDRPGLVMQV